MVVILLFVLFAALENLLLPALIGPRVFFIIPIFVLCILVYGDDTKAQLLKAGIFLFIAELISGARIGSSIIPFGITAVIYIWLNRFLDIRSGIKDSESSGGAILSSFIITLLVYLYSWFYIFIQSSYSIDLAWNEWRMMALGSLVQTLGWSAGLSVLFKYVLRNK